MEKTQYYKEKLSEMISSLPDEQSAKLLQKLVPLLPCSVVTRTLQELGYDLNDYYLASKDEMMKRLSSMETVEVKGTISRDGWNDEDYEKGLDEETAKFLGEAISLAIILYRQGKKEPSYTIVNQISVIDFDCTFFDEYDEDYEESESYSIDDYLSSLALSKEDIEMFQTIRSRSVLENGNVDKVIELLSIKSDKEFTNLIDEMKRDNPTLLYAIGERICSHESPYRCFYNKKYLYESIGDYGLFKKALAIVHSPELLLSFLDKYHDLLINEGPAKKDCLSAISLYISKITEYDAYKHRGALRVLINSFEDNRDYILKYYELYDGDESFLIFNNIEEPDFSRLMKPRDIRFLKPEAQIYQHIEGLSEISSLTRCIFNTASKEDNPALYTGGLKYLQKVRINKALVLTCITNHIVNIGRRYSSKNYDEYVSIIRRTEEEINKEVDLRQIVADHFPTRPKLLSELRPKRRFMSTQPWKDD